MAKAKTKVADKNPSPAGGALRPAPQASAEEQARVVKSFVQELTARPDAQVQIVRDAIPSLSSILGVDIPQVDMNPREHAAPPAPGPMTRNTLVDPKDLVNADAGQPVKVGPPAGGIEAQTTLAVGEAINDAVTKTEKAPAKRKAATKKK